MGKDGVFHVFWRNWMGRVAFANNFQDSWMVLAVRCKRAQISYRERRRGRRFS